MIPSEMPERQETTNDLPRVLPLAYFRVVMPVITLAGFWATLVEGYENIIPVTIHVVSTFLLAATYHLFSEKWQKYIRWVFAILQTAALCLLAILAPTFKITVGPILIQMMLIIIPMHSLAWSFLFFDNPRLGRLLNFLIATASASVISYWLETQNMPVGIAIMMFISSLLAAQFGWRIASLQKQVIHGENEARRDALTGLLNRRAFNEMAISTHGKGTVAMLDIDLFKRINDLYGHDAGDRVLRALADILLDVSQVGMTAYRWGGEEFVVVMPQQSANTAKVLLEGVRQELTKRSFIGGTHVTLSVGLSEYGDLPLLEAFVQADQALLHAKQTGRDRIVVHSEHSQAIHEQWQAKQKQVN